jgi:methyl-accepting chemotaxis protein
MGNKSLSFKIIFSISILAILIFFSCIYCITMINKAQAYANDTGTNWFPSVTSNSYMNLYLSNYARRTLFIIAKGLDKDNSEFTENYLELTNFREKLEKEIKNYEPFLVPPDEPAIYQNILSSLKEFTEKVDYEILLVKQGKSHEALIDYITKGRPAFQKLSDAIDKDVKFNIDGGFNSTKKGVYLTTLTNWSMFAVISISLLS